MPIEELRNINIVRENYHGVFIPAVSHQNFLNITQKLYNELGLKCEPYFFAMESFHGSTKGDKLVGSFASVSIERHFKQKDPDYNSLTHSQKEELESAYTDKVLSICQEICDKYQIELLYKAHLLFPIQGVTFLNYKITPSN